MEELTIEQKAQRYDEALERARKELQTCGSSDCDAVRQIFRFFPVLKESEDERIRKRLIEFFNDWGKTRSHCWSIYIPDILAWLEKQGKQKHAETVKWSPQEESYICQLESLIKEQWRQADKVHNSVNVKKMSELMFFLKTLNPNKKPVDKVEPKFHEGEWVVFECGEETATLQITRIVGKTYVFSDNSTLDLVNEDTLRLWDITKDAKDGDVLVDGNLPFIFKKIDTNKYCYAYCGISVDNGFKIESDGESGEWTWMQDIKPATKEQRDTLEKAMKDAGYTFDFEKKELKKIENIRKDTFIEKAVNFIEEINDVDGYTWYNEEEHAAGITEKCIEDFKKYMKGE